MVPEVAITLSDAACVHPHSAARLRILTTLYHLHSLEISIPTIFILPAIQWPRIPRHI